MAGRKERAGHKEEAAAVGSTAEGSALAAAALSRRGCKREVLGAQSRWEVERSPGN
jgi:hypothetical protein